MLTPTAEKLADNLLAAKKKHETTKNLALAGGLLFWAFTALAAIYVFQDVGSFFANANRAKILIWWSIPAAFFIFSSRRAEAAAGEWKDLKKAAIQKVNPEFCSHQSSCHCRQDFLQEMKEKGIDLY